MQGEPPVRPQLTTVWAKVTSFPFFPAVIVDHVKDWETVPQAVLDLEEGEKQGKDGPVRLVRFYGKTRTFGWVTEDRLAVLGTDADEAYLAVSTTRGVADE